MFQRKEREVITDFGPEAKTMRSKNNRWLLKGRVRLSGLYGPWVVSLVDSGGGSAHAQCCCVCPGACEKAHHVIVVMRAEGKTHLTSQQILRGPGRDPHLHPMLWGH